MICHTGLTSTTSHAKRRHVTFLAEAHRLAKHRVIMKIELGHCNLLGLLLCWGHLPVVENKRHVVEMGDGRRL